MHCALPTKGRLILFVSVYVSYYIFTDVNCGYYYNKHPIGFCVSLDPFKFAFIQLSSNPILQTEEVYWNIFVGSM